MKKVIYTLLIVAIGNTVFAQGFLKKVKAKVAQVVAQPVASEVPAGMGSGRLTNTNWTDPGVCGTLVKTFSKKEIDDHMGGFDLWIPSLKVVNNQLQLQVADNNAALYNLVNGQLVKAGTPPEVDRNKLKNGNESELMSVDFSQMDMANAMMKRGPHVSNGMIPGKPMQTLTFNGKVLGSFYIFALGHNADSSAVAVVGTSIGPGGMKYTLVTSTGQTATLPKLYGGQALVSPDGKLGAAYYGATSTGGQAYLSNGTVVKVASVSNNMVWLRNSGSVFNVEQSHNSLLYKNGLLYHEFTSQIEMRNLFLGKDDKVLCWEGDHGLYFSDGTAFENGESPHKVLIDGKEIMVFLTVNLTSGQVYLCKKEL
jgi:hypothetical protein